MLYSRGNVSSQHLGHLGLVAATIAELGIVDKIDSRIELNEIKGGIVSYGRRVAAMILNGLGFMNSRLCMTTHFFQDKPVAQLLGDEVTAEHLNDDCLGRCLDKIAEYGVTQLYAEMAFEIAQEKDILGKRMHLDTTSFSLYGEYDDIEYIEGAPMPMYGFSKDHRPDLKQVTLSLIQSGVANIPLWMETLNGNSSDKISFHQTVARVKTFVELLHQSPSGLCFVVDAAFYTPQKLAELNNVYWITRVPAQLKETKAWINTPNEKVCWKQLDDNYRATEQLANRYGVEQRWILIESKHAMKRELKTLNRRIEKEYDELDKALWHLGHKIFGCSKDAQEAMKVVLKSIKYHHVDFSIVAIEKHDGAGRPKAGASKKMIGHRIESIISSCLDKIERKKQSMGRFILATNQKSIETLSEHEVLKQYKEQSNVESGFKFIKDNAFELSSFYLKTPSRIGALMMIMTLCLMVYNFAQYKMRKCIEENDEVLPNQVGKPVKNPTIKWVAELMHMIAVVTIITPEGTERVVTNVKKVHQRIIAYFGEQALKIYGLDPELQRVDIDYSNYKNLLHWCEV